MNSGDAPIRDLEVRIRSKLPLNYYGKVEEIEPKREFDIEIPVVPKRCGTFDIEITLRSPDFNYVVERSVVVKGFDRVSIDLRSDVTEATVGEEFDLTLSVVNLISNPNMTVQVILIPPSGMSISSSYFTPCGGGQFEGVFRIKPGEMRAIEIGVMPNEPGNYTIRGIIVYYFGKDRGNATVKEISIPIVVRPKKTPGFCSIVGALILSALGLRGWGRWRISARS